MGAISGPDPRKQHVRGGDKAGSVSGTSASGAFKDSSVSADVKEARDTPPADVVGCVETSTCVTEEQVAQLRNMVDLAGRQVVEGVVEALKLKVELAQSKLSSGGAVLEAREAKKKAQEARKEVEEAKKEAEEAKKKAQKAKMKTQKAKKEAEKTKKEAETHAEEREARIRVLEAQVRTACGAGGVDVLLVGAPWVRVPAAKHRGKRACSR